MKKAIMIVCVVIASIVLFAGVVAVCGWIVNEKEDRAVKDEVVAYLRENTEDQGDYLALVQEFTDSDVAEYPDARFFFAVFVDDNGDWEICIVRYLNGEIVEENLLWR